MNAEVLRRWLPLCTLTSCMLDTAPEASERDKLAASSVEMRAWQPMSAITAVDAAQLLRQGAAHAATSDAGILQPMAAAAAVVAPTTAALEHTDVPAQDTDAGPAPAAARSAPASDAGSTQAKAPPPQCPRGDGAYCGGHGIAGTHETIYACAAGQITPVIECPFGCERVESAAADRCSDPPDAGGAPPPASGSPPPGWNPGAPPPGSPPPGWNPGAPPPGPPPPGSPHS